MTRAPVLCPACERASDENRTCAPYHLGCLWSVLCTALRLERSKALLDAIGVALDELRELGEWPLAKPVPPPMPGVVHIPASPALERAIREMQQRPGTIVPYTHYPPVILPDKDEP